MHQKNAAYEQKVAMAAKGITGGRELEKEKLTTINIDKHTVK